MNSMPPIAMLWDDSHIWGLMSLRALGSLGFPTRLLKGQDIAQGALLRKQAGGEPYALLVVPGGSAQLKAEALGDAGKRAICDYIRLGGCYLGFCGGAGLALTLPQSRGLGLCPWRRAEYPQRMLHLLSGYVQADPCPNALTPDWGNHAPSLPVWWPGRFSNSGGDVEVLARYRGPDRDFWIADIALDSVPKRIFEEWKRLYGINLTADFLADTELMVTGRYGKGRYVLSYSHLETPDSSEANAWLVHILKALTCVSAASESVPAWNFLFKRKSPDPGIPPLLSELLSRIRDLVDLAMEHRLFFARTPWLVGWKQGLPGAMCNNLLAATVASCSVLPGREALHFWSESESEITSLVESFFAGAEGYLLAARLMETMHASMTGVMDRGSLVRERDRLFGHPMLGKGILGRLLFLLEEYLYLCIADRGCREVLLLE